VAQHHTGHIGSRPVRSGGELSSKLAVRVVQVLRAPGCKGSKMQGRRKTMRE
jgi:hypothetical protein